MLPENEKPNNANAVIAVLTAATFAVPKRLMILALVRLDIIVPPETREVTKFA